MGCNYSTINNSMGSNNSAMKDQSGADVFPERIRPLLARRLEEFKNRRNNGGGSLRGGDEAAISKKQLLTKDGGAAAEGEGDDGNFEPVVCVEKLSKVVPLPVSDECGAEEEDHNKGHKDQEQEKEKGVENKDKDEVEVLVKVEIGKSVKPQAENKHEDANKKLDDDDDAEDEIERLLGPGSPSFRIYCIDAEKKKEKEECEKQIVAIIVHRKTPSDVSVENAESASSNSNKEAATLKVFPDEMKPTQAVESSTKRKGPRRKKIMMIKRNLLNPKNLQIKNRINPMFACTGSNRKTLLSPH